MRIDQTMNIPENIKNIIFSDDIEAADVALSQIIAGECDASRLGQLATDLIKRGMFRPAVKVFAKWTELDASNPEPWSNLGLCLTRLREHEQAKSCLEHALGLDQGFAMARHNLCEVLKELGEHQPQLLHALEGVRLEPASAVAFNNLGTALIDNGMLTEAKHAFETSRLLDPNSFAARFNLAWLAAEEGRTEVAVEFFEAALENPGNNKVQRVMLEYYLGQAYLTLGRLSEGWQLYEQRFSSSVLLGAARVPKPSFPVPFWDGRPLKANETLMIWREQGIGDELRFAALLPELKNIGGQIIVECDPRLVDSFQRSLSAFHVRPSPTDPQRTISRDECDYDFHLSMGSLAGHYLQSPDLFYRLGGYLKPSLFQAAKFAQHMSSYDGIKKVGICWRSHQLSATRNKKYTSLEDWSEILSTPNVVFVNLQYGECEQELLDAERRHGIKILRWSDIDLKDDLEAVMGIMQNLDLVISPSTAVVPLAGAIGRKTIFIGHSSWVMLGEKTRYPWFSSVHPVLVDKTLPVASGLPEAKRLTDVFLSGAV